VAVLRPGRFALDTRIATVVLALVLAMVGMPLVGGGALVVGSHCAITMDICHSAQSADLNNAVLFAPAPRLFSMNNRWRDAVLAIEDPYESLAGRLGEAPALRPPETLA
jgi:hypothetical protein